jgi:hypothetical protein
MTDEELIRRGDVRKAILEYLEETGSELERWDIDQIVSGIAAEDRIEELERQCSVYARSDRLLVEDINELEAKLTKAVEALRFYTHDYVFSGDKARAALAELEAKE